MQKIKLEAKIRTDKPNRVRLGGLVPGIVYGKGMEAVSIEIEAKKLTSLFGAGTNKNVLVTLDIKGMPKELILPVIAHEIQQNAMNDKITHIDFVKINMEEEIKTKVPVIFVGEAVGVKLDGGILVQAMRQLEIKCLPDNIPDKIEIDVTPLKIGESIHVSGIVPPKGVTIVTSKEDAVVTVTSPAKEEEVAPAAEAVAVEGAPAADAAAPAADAKAAPAPEAEKGKAAKPSK